MAELKGRNRRLAYEQQKLEELAARRDWMELSIIGTNGAGVANHYRVIYNIRCMCGVEDIERLGTPGVQNAPIFADRFVMDIEIPYGYPSIDAMPTFRFLTHDEGKAIPHPWHPNIRWFGDMAGRVCINMPDTYADIAWCVERVARYLRYEIYHAVNEPPYPEDQQVAAWVIRQYEA